MLAMQRIGKSGRRGIVKGPNGKWMVTVYKDGKTHYGGVYKSINEAMVARADLKRSLK